jgi:beta-glucosidase
MIKIIKITMLKLLLFYCVFLISACNTDSDVGLEPSNKGVAKTDNWWLDRHKKVLATDNSKAKILFIGDSITHNWESPSFGFGIWQQFYGENAVNLGFSGDKTQNLLWRIENGEIDDMSPEITVLLIGTNNAEDYSTDEIASGVNAIIDVVLQKLPKTHILVHRIFPRGVVTDPLRKITDTASEKFSQRANTSDRVTYLDLNTYFIDGQGNIPEDIMADGLHPSTKGYAIWANELSNHISL